jgi:hypothetical protein
MTILLLASSITFSSSYIASPSAVIVCLRYVACLVVVEVESFVILPFMLLRVDLGSVEVYIIHIYYINVLRCANLVAVIVLISFP